MALQGARQAGLEPPVPVRFCVRSFPGGCLHPSDVCGLAPYPRNPAPPPQSFLPPKLSGVDSLLDRLIKDSLKGFDMGIVLKRRTSPTWLGDAGAALAMPANPLRGLGRAARLAPEGKSAETHPTARLRPLRSWLLRPTSPWLERGPYIAESTLSQFMNEEEHRSEAQILGKVLLTNVLIYRCEDARGKSSDSVRVCHRTFAAEPDLAALEFPFCCLATGSDQLPAQPQPPTRTLSLPVQLGPS